MDSISEAAFEFTVEKMAQSFKRLLIITIITILALVGTNIAWIIHDGMYDSEMCVVESGGDGNANYIGNDGDNINGTDSR